METVLLAYFFYHFGLPEHFQPNQVARQKLRETVGQVHIEQQVPAKKSFPAGAQRVSLLEIQLRATCEADVSIDAIEVTRKGLGAASDITSVYAIQGYNRLTNPRQVQRNGTARLRFRNFTVPACTTTSVTIAADFSDDAAIASEHWFTIASANAVQTEASVYLQATKNRKLNTRKPYTSGGTPVGTISVEYPALTKRVRYGTNQTVARFRLEADNRSHHHVHAITFTNNGSATDGDLQNLVVTTSANQKLSKTAAQLNNDSVRLEFTPPLLLQKNQQRLLTVQADVRASRSRTLQFRIQEPSDIEATPVRRRE